MAYLTKEDLSSHLYGENINEITRGNDDIITNAIDSAVAEAKSKLSRFNLTKLFDPNANGFVADINLKNKVKDIACYNLVTLANPNIAYDVLLQRYKDAISWLKDVRDGNEDPENWPYKDDDSNTDYPEGSAVSMYSNIPRRNSY